MLYFLLICENVQKVFRNFFRKIKKLKLQVQKTSRKRSENFCEKVKIKTCSEGFHVKKNLPQKIKHFFSPET